MSRFVLIPGTWSELERRGIAGREFSGPGGTGHSTVRPPLVSILHINPPLRHTRP